MPFGRSKRFDWQGAALALAGEIPLKRLHPRVVAWASMKARAPRAAWGVGFSGGADSLALLLLLWAHWPARRSRLVALHFNHRLRGPASGGDLRFCRAVCAGLGVSLLSGSWVRRERTAPVGEAAARTARFAFFEGALAEAGARSLWLGHQKDDIAESIMMRLARGSGTAGLAAPRPLQTMTRGRVHVRCLLTLTKSELAAALQECGIPWREDESNRRGEHFRNRIRQRVLPAWRRAARDRDALGGAALSREMLEEDADALELWVERANPLRGKVLHLDTLSGVPRAVTRRALQRWLLVLGGAAGDLSRQGFEILLRAVEAGSPLRLSLGKDGFAIIEDLRLKYRQKVTKKV